VEVGLARPKDRRFLTTESGAETHVVDELPAGSASLASFSYANARTSRDAELDKDAKLKGIFLSMALPVGGGGVSAATHVAVVMIVASSHPCVYA
jgi:hypothetical protein